MIMMITMFESQDGATGDPTKRQAALPHFGNQLEPHRPIISASGLSFANYMTLSNSPSSKSVAFLSEKVKIVICPGARGREAGDEAGPAE